MATETLFRDRRSEFQQVIGSWNRRLRLQQMLVWLPRSLMPGLIIGIVLAILSRLRPLLLGQQILIITGALVALGLVSMLLVVWLWPRRALPSARQFDVMFGLGERVSTAIELIEGQITSNNELTALQIDDAWTRAQTVQSREYIPLRWPWRDWLMVIIAMLVFALLVWLPNPQAEAIAENNAQDAAIEEAAEDLKQITEEIATDSNLDAEERERLLEELEMARETLEQEDITPEEAFATLSEVQSELQEQAEEFQQRLQAQQDALQQAAEALRQLSAAQQQESAQSQQQQQQQSLGEMLAQMAQNMESMSESERQQAADTLDQIADMLEATNPQAADALRRAAQAMRDGNPAQAQQALQDAQQALEEGQQSQQAQNQSAQQLNQAAQQTQQAANQISQAGQQQNNQQGERGQSQQGQQSQQNGSQLQPLNQQGSQSQQGAQQADQQGQQGQQSQQGQAGQQGQAQQPGQQGQQGQQGQAGQQGQQGAQQQGQQGQSGQLGQGQGTGQTQMQSQGQNNQSGQGQNTGSGAGDEAGGQQQSGNQPADGTTDQNNNPDGQGEGQYDSIYSPPTGRLDGPEGGGIVLEPDPGDLPAIEGEFSQNPAGESTVPYNEVFSDYADDANRALESDYIPLGMRDLVRDYFSSLEPGQDSGSGDGSN